ncbi:MAG: hydroxyacylglutathione hydrolase [Acidobacteriota bacterium]|nr:hydroxyacylglutathione hydrolase [Acidobacteriota bacterium]
MVQFTPIPAFSDNYIWMIGSAAGPDVAVVDPGEAGPVLAEIEARDLKLVAMLLTHHHGDHVGGVEELLVRHPVPVFGPANERIDGVDRPVRGGDVISVPELDLSIGVVDVPGHTAGHVAYGTPGFALVGDTMFAGGCGRVFEGTMEQMHHSLALLAELPPETLIFCAHEYTLANLRFALEVEPGNQALQQRLADATRARAINQPTVPSTLAVELATNPFLRCDQPDIVSAAETRAGRRLSSVAEVFAVVRGWKDGWRG